MCDLSSEDTPTTNTLTILLAYSLNYRIKNLVRDWLIYFQNAGQVNFDYFAVIMGNLA